MKAINNLPSHYIPAGVLDMTNWRLALSLNVVGLLLVPVFGWPFLLVTVAARPELTTPRLATLVEASDAVDLLLGLLVVLALHELVHGLFFRLYTGSRPKLGFHLLYAYAAAPEWYLPRGQFLVVGLAPLVGITAASLFLLPFTPFAVVPALLLALTANAAGSAGDLAAAAWLLRHHPQALIQDTGPRINRYEPLPAEVASISQRWSNLVEELGIDHMAARQVLADLAARYSEHGRHYHTLDHIEHVLEVLANLQSSARDSSALQLAAWFHDAVYTPGAPNNEARSADYAKIVLEELRLPAEIVTRVGELILLTAGHQAPADDPDAQILLDADLAILGAYEDTYDRYTQAIRKEFAWVPEETFRVGRAQLLSDLLARDRLYRTELLFKALEGQARRNLARELASLTNGN